MKPAARHRIGHVATQFPIGGACVHLRAACPVAQGIDLGARIPLLQLGGRGMALAEGQPCFINDVLPI